MKKRIHKEWFRTIILKHCPTCGARNVQVWSWGEYINGKWRTVQHFCDFCIKQKVEPSLLEHAKKCGCTFQLTGYRGIKLSYALLNLQNKINQQAL